MAGTYHHLAVWLCVCCSYFFNQLRMLHQGDASIFVVGAGDKYQLRDGVTFHLYVSGPLHGDYEESAKTGWVVYLKNHLCQEWFSDTESGSCWCTAVKRNAKCAKFNLWPYPPKWVTLILFMKFWFLHTCKALSFSFQMVPKLCRSAYRFKSYW